ncbi:MAG: radical SAM protein [Bdellovibrionales bacterium]|nr:radical SAM protein [Bdellovibrionales bacterium]
MTGTSLKSNLAFQSNKELCFGRVVFLLPPTGGYCREDRCQSYFHVDLIPTARPPLEECEAAGAIGALGGTSLVIDAPVEQLSEGDVLSRIREFSPDLIVVSTTFGTLSADKRWVSLLLESFPGVPVALRGAPCYVFPEEILESFSKEENVFCLRGEYESVFAALAQEGVQRAPGVVWRRDKSVVSNPSPPPVSNLDEFPFPDRSSLNQSRYRVKGLRAPQATIHVQRGCPFPCTYCLVHTVSGAKARHRSPEHIVKEIRSLMEEGVRYFYLRAETFSLNKRWAIQLSNLLATECPGARWVTATRVECVDDEVVAAMKSGGCYGISFGVDVASEEIGRYVRKPPRRKEAMEAMRLCDRHGIISLAYIMIGFLWETEQSLEESSTFIREIRPDLVTVHFTHPYPGTVYYEEFVKQAIPLLSQRAQAMPAHECSSISIARLGAHAEKIRREHYRRPSVLFSLAKKFGRHGLRHISDLVPCTVPREQYG